MSNKPPRPPIPPRHEKDVSDVSSTFLNKLGAAERASIELKNANAALAKKEAELSSLKEQINRRVGPSSPQEMKAVEQAGFDIDAARRRVGSVRESVKLKTAERTASTIMDRRVHENQFSTLTKAISSDPNLISQEYQRLIGDRQVTPQLLHELSSKNSAILSHLKPTVRTNIATGLYGAKSRDDVASTVMTSRLGDYSQALKDKAGLAVISSDYDRKQKEAEKAQRDAQKAEEKKALDAQKMANKAKEEEDKKLKFEEVQGKKKEREESDKRELVRKANSRSQKELFKQEIADELIVEKDKERKTKESAMQAKEVANRNEALRKANSRSMTSMLREEEATDVAIGREGKRKALISERVKGNLSELLEKEEKRRGESFLKSASQGGLQGLAQAYGFQDAKVFTETQKKQLDELSAKLQELGKVFSETAILTEEQVKQQEDLSKAYQKQEHIVKAIDRVREEDKRKGEDNLNKAGMVVSGLSSAVSAADYFLVGSELDDLSLKKSIASEKNRVYDKQKAAAEGDMAALFSFDAGAEDFGIKQGNAFSSRVDGIRLAKGGVNIAGGFLDVLGGVARGGPLGGLGASADVAGNMVVEAVKNSKRIPQILTDLQGRGLSRELIDEVLAPAYRATGAFKDFSMGKMGAVSGAGKDSSNIFDQVSGGFLSENANMSAEEILGLTQSGIAGVGSKFIKDPTGVVGRAGDFKKSGLGSSQDYISLLAQSVNSGGGVSSLEGVVNTANRLGMSNLKSINSMTDIVSSISGPLVSSGIEGGRGAVNMLSSALGASAGSGLSDETRLSMAKNDIQRMGELSGPGMDIAGIISASKIQTQFAGKSGIEQIAMSNTDLNKLRQIEGMEGKARKIAMDRAGISNEEELQKLLGIKKSEFVDRVGIMGTSKARGEVSELLDGKKKYDDLSSETKALLGAHDLSAFLGGVGQKADFSKRKLGQGKGDLGSTQSIETINNISRAQEIIEGEGFSGGVGKIATLSGQKLVNRNNLSDQLESTLAGVNQKNIDAQVKGKGMSGRQISEGIQGDARLKSIEEAKKEFEEKKDKMIGEIGESISNGAKAVKDSIVAGFNEGVSAIGSFFGLEKGASLPKVSQGTSVKSKAPKARQDQPGG